MAPNEQSKSGWTCFHKYQSLFRAQTLAASPSIKPKAQAHRNHALQFNEALSSEFIRTWSAIATMQCQVCRVNNQCKPLMQTTNQAV